MNEVPNVAVLRERYATLDGYAGARLVTLGDGAERGVRVLELRSGGGLDLEIVVDRGFDIGRVAIGGQTVSWHSGNGLRAPWLTAAHSDRGQGFLRAASGFLVTCGLDHIRQPETDNLDAAPLHPDGAVDYPLHGDGSGQPARLVGYGLEEDAERPFLWAEGEVVQSMTFHSTLRLRRRITVPLGGTGFGIADRVSNIGPFVSTHMLLYHFNLGFPLIDAGTEIGLEAAKETWRGSEHQPLAPFAAPAERQTADLSVFRMDAASRGLCRVHNRRRQLALELAFDQKTLPFFQLLRMGGRGLYGAGLEPCTAGARSRREAREQNQMILLQPGEGRDYSLEVSFSHPPAAPASAS